MPTDKTEIDGISKEQQTHYQLGLIYKEKFKEYELATAGKIVTEQPEEKLVLPTLV
jgi:hypothetical protein